MVTYLLFNVTPSKNVTRIYKSNILNISDTFSEIRSSSWSGAGVSFPTRKSFETKVSIFRCGSRLNIVSPTPLAHRPRDGSPVQSHLPLRRLYTHQVSPNYFLINLSLKLNLIANSFCQRWLCCAIFFWNSWTSIHLYYVCSSKHSLNILIRSISILSCIPLPMHYVFLAAPFTI